MRSPLAQKFIKELIVLCVLLVVGAVLLPIGVYLTGGYVFGPYAEGGLGAFLSRLARGLVGGRAQLWLLVLAPYLIWQSLRLTIWGLRRPPAERNGTPHGS